MAASNFCDKRKSALPQIQIDIIINVSLKHRNVQFYRKRKNQIPLRLRALEATH